LWAPGLTARWYSAFVGWPQCISDFVAVFVCDCISLDHVLVAVCFLGVTCWLPRLFGSLLLLWGKVGSVLFFYCDSV